jgi:hypothetical protein
LDAEVAKLTQAVLAFPLPTSTLWPTARLNGQERL